MDSSGGREEKFSNHPCHRLSVPAAKRFWCRHCFEMFDDPISRWRHSKTCKNTGLSNLTRRKEQEATALEAYCESTLQTRSDDGKQLILPNLNPRSTNKSYIGPKENSAVDLSCFICKKQFSTMEEMKDHVRVPCNKVVPVPDDIFPFSTSRSVPKPSTSEIIFHGESSEAGASGTVYEFGEDGSLSKKRTPSPLDPSNLSSETMAAVEALNMMARSDKVNLTQFLNQLSEGGFVIEQAAGTSTASDTQDREIIFTVQGDVGESGDLLQHGGDITVEVAEDLIRMAQRVRVEAVERVVEEQVQEEVVQDDLEQQTEVQYIQADQAAEFMQGHTQLVQDQTQYVEQQQYVDQQPQTEQSQIVQVEPVHQQTDYVQEQPQFVQEHNQYVAVQQENEQSGYTIMSGKDYTEHIVTQGHLSTIQLQSVQDNAQVLVVPVDEHVVDNREPENLPSIPDGKRKLEEDIPSQDGMVHVKVENGSQVKKLCTEVVVQPVVSDSAVKEEAFEAKKKLQFFNEGLIVQEKCNKNVKTTEKMLENELEPRDDVKYSQNEIFATENKLEQTTDIIETRTFLDEIDGFFKPMTKEMIKYEESILDICTRMTVDSTSPEFKMTAVKRKPCIMKNTSLSPKKLRSSSRRLVLTPKKKRMLEEKEKRKSKNIMKEKPDNFKKEMKSLEVKSTVTSKVKEERKKDRQDATVSKQTEKNGKIQPPKQLKCRACEKVFNSIKSLQKHKSVPCVVKITRNLCQKILRPKRALPKPPEKKVVKKKINKPEKDMKKPKLLPVGFHIQAQWIPCKRERKPSKGRGRPRKNTVHYERKKRIILPDRTIEISSLSEKEQFLFELGLVCSEYVLKEFRRPLPQPPAKVMTSLSVSVDSNDSEGAAVSDISPPLLEKIEPTDVTDEAPDLEEEELGPPLLEPAVHKLKEETTLSMSTTSEEKLVPETDRHFMDSFCEGATEKAVSSSDKTSAENECSRQDALSVISKDVLVTEEVTKHESPKRSGLLPNFKSTLTNVCSAQKVATSPKSQELGVPDLAGVSPQSKRNLFETLQTICSTHTKSTLSYVNSPNISVSSLCNSATSLSEKLSPLKSACTPKKCSSVQSSPKKGPNILRRSFSESASKEQTDSILEIVAKSMGIPVDSAKLESSPVKPHSPNCKAENITENWMLSCKKNLFENCESLLHDNASKTVSAEVVEKVRSKVLGKSKHFDPEKSKTFKKTCNANDLKPLISLTPSQTGQILVSPIKLDSRSNPSRSGHSHHRGVKRKLCDASTQCERVASSSPVKVMLGQLEHRLKLLKSALKSQSNLQCETGSGSPVKLKEKKELLPELVSVIMNHNSETGKVNLCGRDKNNLPDVVKSATESTDVLDNTKSFMTHESVDLGKKVKVSTGGNSEGSASNENSSDFGSEAEQTDSCSLDSAHSSDKVQVQYINQLESNGASGVTYFLIQQEGMEDYLTSCLSSDLDIESGETIHAVSVEEKDIHTRSLSFNKGVKVSVDREVFVNSSGF